MAHRNSNYWIITTKLDDGRVFAKAHGRNRSVRTFHLGTTEEDAALQLAVWIEGSRVSHVKLRDDYKEFKWEELMWDVYVE